MSGSERERFILHADMDAFYASIEQRDDPALRGRPVIIGATSARGVVAAASYEARVYGVRSAMPGFQARQLCPDGVFLPSDIRKYARVSEQVHEVFSEFTDLIEPLALDEAFLDVTGSTALFGGPASLCKTLKRRVREAVDLPVSVALAPSKLVAKIACSLGKPDGMLIVPPEAVRWLLDPLPVRRIWGVGPVLGRLLDGIGIRTIGELAEFDEEALKGSIGDRASELQKLARGDDSRAVEASRAPKSYGEENTFEQDISDREVVTAAITAHAEAVARRVRRDGYRGRTVTLKIKLARRRGDRASRIEAQSAEPIYPVLTRSKTLARPTDDGALIREVAVALWDGAALGEPVRLLGVSLSNLEARAFEQLELFAPQRPTFAAGGVAPERPADRLGPALDAIAARFGDDAIRRAVDTPEKVTPSMRKKRGE